MVTSRAEYGANYVAMLQRCKTHGCRIVEAPTAPSGAIDVEALGELFEKEKPTVMVLCHIPTNGGLVNDAEGVGKMVKKHNVPWYVLDACQSAGQRVLDVQEIGIKTLF